MLDFELAQLYGIQTRVLKQAVRRNIERFEGEDFMFELTESEYNSAPMFEGDLELIGGDITGVVLGGIQSGGVNSTVSTNVISAMAFYDFFEGYQKPLNQFIPYIGFGLGYADVTTVLNLADLYGDLSRDLDLTNYGELVELADGSTYTVFYTSEKNTANIAGLLALGFSYGVADGVYLDGGVRFTYVPQIKWALSNADESKQREWFEAKNIFYTNIMLGLRFEF